MSSLKWLRASWMERIVCIARGQFVSSVQVYTSSSRISSAGETLATRAAVWKAVGHPSSGGAMMKRVGRAEDKAKPLVCVPPIADKPHTDKGFVDNILPSWSRFSKWTKDVTI